MRFLLGGESIQKYPVFNGEFANPVYGVGAGRFVGTAAELQKVIGLQSVPSPYMDKLKTVKLANTPYTQTADTSDKGEEYGDSTDDFSSEYAVSGWFRWVPPPTQVQWTFMYRLTNTSPAQVGNL